MILILRCTRVYISIPYILSKVRLMLLLIFWYNILIIYCSKISSIILLLTAFNALNIFYILLFKDIYNIIAHVLYRNTNSKLLNILIALVSFIYHRPIFFLYNYIKGRSHIKINIFTVITICLLYIISSIIGIYSIPLLCGIEVVKSLIYDKNDSSIFINCTNRIINFLTGYENYMIHNSCRIYKYNNKIFVNPFFTFRPKTRELLYLILKALESKTSIAKIEDAEGYSIPHLSFRVTENLMALITSSARFGATKIKKDTYISFTERGTEKQHDFDTKTNIIVICRTLMALHKCRESGTITISTNKGSVTKKQN